MLRDFEKINKNASSCIVQIQRTAYSPLQSAPGYGELGSSPSLSASLLPSLQPVNYMLNLI